MQDEIARAQAALGSNDPTGDDIFVLALPPGHGDTEFLSKGGRVCGRHTDSHAANGHVATMIVLPFQPDSRNCRAWWSNASPDAVGHGYFDGVGMTLGHEIAEVLTDPFGHSWHSAGGDETGDKCNNIGTNLGRPVAGLGMVYASSQFLYSNQVHGCVFPAAGQLALSPMTINFGARDVNSIYSTQISASNTGTADLFVGMTSPWTLTDPSGSFTVADGVICGPVLHPGDSCTATVNFMPTAAGPEQATVTFNVGYRVTTDARGIRTVSTGTTPLGSISVHGTGRVRSGLYLAWEGAVRSACLHDCTTINTVQVRNDDRVSHAIASAMLEGNDPADFAVGKDACTGTMLTPGQSCSIDVTFSPESIGLRQAVVTVTQDGQSVQTFAAAGATSVSYDLAANAIGIGPDATLSYPGDTAANVLSFPLTRLGVPQEEAVTLTASGKEPLIVKSIKVRWRLHREGLVCWPARGGIVVHDRGSARPHALPGPTRDAHDRGQHGGESPAARPAWRCR